MRETDRRQAYFGRKFGGWGSNFQVVPSINDTNLGLNFTGKTFSEVRQKEKGEERPDSANKISYPQQKFQIKSKCFFGEERQRREKEESKE